MVYNSEKYVSKYKQGEYIKDNIELEITLNGAEMTVLAILKKKPDLSWDEIADKISKTVRTAQRALDSLRDKDHIRRVESKQNPIWEVLR